MTLNAFILLIVFIRSTINFYHAIGIQKIQFVNVLWMKFPEIPLCSVANEFRVGNSRAIWIKFAHEIGKQEFWDVNNFNIIIRNV